VLECDKPQRSKGYCNPHYQRFLRHGDPLAGEQRARQRDSLVGQVFGKWRVTERRGSLCGHARYLCVCVCGTEKLQVATNLRAGQTQSCGCSRVGPKGRPWGSGTKNEDGYIVLHRPSHPNARASGDVFEHTVVMSEVLGRPLFSDENVHHKNGVKDDNHPENLELWTKSQPAGQRVKDKIAWALELLDRYASAPPQVTGTGGY